MKTITTKTFTAKTLAQRTSALALTTTLILLSAQAGYCLNPQPLPPAAPVLPHHLPSLLHILWNAIRHIIIVGG